MAYVSDKGKRTAPKRQKPKARVQRSPSGDIASSGGDYGTGQAKRYTSKAAFRESVRSVYEAQPTKERVAISHGTPGRPGPAAAAITHEHESRIARNYLLARYRALNPGSGMDEANKYLKDHPEILKHHDKPDKDSDGPFTASGLNLDLGDIVKGGVGRAAKTAESYFLSRATGGPLGKLEGKLADRNKAGYVAAGPGVGLEALGKATNIPGLESVGKYTKETLRNLPSDYVDTYAELVPSTVHLAQTAVTKGPKAAGEQLLAFPEAVYHDPLGTFQEHPYATWLLGRGAKGVVGRAAGKAMRSVPGPTRRMAATARETPSEGNARAYEGQERTGTSLHEDTRYSKDVLSKATEVAMERLAKKSPTVAKVVPQRLKPTDVMSDAQVRTRVDEFFGAHENLRRDNVRKAVGVTRDAVGKKATPGQILSVQNLIEPTKKALQEEHDRLVEQQQNLKGVRLAQNQDSVSRIADELKNFDSGRYGENLDQYQTYSAGQQAKLGALYGQSERVAEANLRPYAVKFMGGREVEGRFVDAQGNRITPDHIRAHMASDEGPGVVGEPAFVSHAPNRSVRGAYYKPSAEAQRVGPAGRSGEAVRQGTFDLSGGVLEENAARSASLTSSAQSFASFIQEFGFGRGKKIDQHDTFREAQNAANEWNNEHPDQRLSPIRTNPFGAGGEQLHALMDRVHTGALTPDEANSQMTGAMQATGGAGPWTLIPEAARSQAIAHMSKQTSTVFDNLAHLYGGQFRKVVLAMSPKWFAGNVIEAALRAAIAGAGPTSFALGRKVIKESGLEGAARDEALHRMVGGGHGRLQGNIAVRASAEQLKEAGAGPVLANIANAMAHARKMPLVHAGAELFNRYSNWVFNSLNGRIEGGFQTAMLGKALRDSPLMEHRTLKVGREAIEEAARGLTNTNNQVAFGRAVDRMFGQYSKFSPGTRRAIALYTPFIAWSLNAIRFITRVLPKDHPLVSAYAASVQVAEKEWREEHGLGAFLDNGVPDFLLGSVPSGGTGEQPDAKYRLSRYTPFGFWGDPLENLAGTVLPQARTIVNAMSGQDFKGDKLPGVDGPNSIEIRSVAAALALLETTIPGAGQAARVFTKPTKGGVLNSGIGPNEGPLMGKYGPFGGRIGKEINPFAPTQSKGSGKTSYFGGSGSGAKPKGKTKYFIP